MILLPIHRIISRICSSSTLSQSNFNPLISVSSPSMAAAADSSNAHLNSLVSNLSTLRDNVDRLNTRVALYAADHSPSSSSSSAALASMNTLIQEIMATASNMMFNCQQMALRPTPPPTTTTTTGNNSTPIVYSYDNPQQGSQSSISGTKNKEDGSCDDQMSTFFASDAFYWNAQDAYNNNASTSTSIKAEIGAFDIVEVDAADLLAKYTHYCQVCGKGFKRDANLRMHMRAHGDEYKSSAALSNPMKTNAGDEAAARKYSCPQEGCRWNRKHDKFQPLKSMICVKNHYKRSHCPKMFVCKRCNRKQFSVLSDLRTHEKHCGDVKWRCTCGTTFSRKDKLMGHVGLFVGHEPAAVVSAAGRSAG